MKADVKKFQNGNSHYLKARFPPLILNLSIRWGISVLLHAPDSLPVTKGFLCPLNMKLSGFEDTSGRFGKEIHPLPMLGIEPRFLGPPSRCLVTNLTELSGLLIVCILHQIFFIIVIIFLHQSGLNRPRLMVSSKVFQVVFVHLVYIGMIK